MAPGMDTRRFRTPRSVHRPALLFTTHVFIHLQLIDVTMSEPAPAPAPTAFVASEAPRSFITCHGYDGLAVVGTLADAARLGRDIQEFWSPRWSTISAEPCSLRMRCAQAGCSAELLLQQNEAADHGASAFRWEVRHGEHCHSAVHSTKVVPPGYIGRLVAK
jgi:hypothetical protein